jgi:hypothetical protein
MRPLLIIAVVSTFNCSSPVFAQAGMGTTMSPLSPTTPLGTNPGTPIAGTGIPMGASPSSAPVVGSLPSYPTGASSTACSTLGTPPTAMYGSPSSYDGGGITLNGTAAPATASMAPAAPATMSSGISATSALSSTSGMAATAGLSGMCGSGAAGVASSSSPISASATPSARAGIPLDSTEIGNLGVSSYTTVPMPSVAPITATVAPNATAPTIPTVSSPSTASSATTTSTLP